jgi:hypothetical protein
MDPEMLRPQNTLFANIKDFYNNWHMLNRKECAGAQVKMALDPAVAKYRKEDCSLLLPKYTQADFIFVSSLLSSDNLLKQLTWI